MAKKFGLTNSLGRLLNFVNPIINSVVSNGGAEDDLDLVGKNKDLANAIGRLIVGKASGTVCFFLFSDFFLPPWAEGLAEGEDREMRFAGKNVELELVDVFNSEESYVFGEEMLKRSLVKTSPAGNRAFEYLATHPELIPDEWQKYALVFPGTVLLDAPCCVRRVHYLFFDDGWWRRGDGWLSVNFNSCCRVVGFRKSR